MEETLQERLNAGFFDELQKLEIEFLRSYGKSDAEILEIMTVWNQEARNALSEGIYQVQQEKSTKEAEEILTKNFKAAIQQVKGDENKEFAIGLLAELDGYLYERYKELQKPENNELRKTCFMLQTWLLNFIQTENTERDIALLADFSALLDAEIYSKLGQPAKVANSVTKKVKNALDEVKAERVLKQAKNLQMAGLVEAVKVARAARNAAQRTYDTRVGQLTRYGDAKNLATRTQGEKAALNAAKAKVVAAEKALLNAGGNVAAEVVAVVGPAAPRKEEEEKLPPMVPPAKEESEEAKPKADPEEEAKAKARALRAKLLAKKKVGGRRTMKKRSKKSKTRKGKKTYKGRRH
jgi:hypothetical protein